MIYADELNKYDNVILYGYITKKIDLYREKIKKSKFYITDSDYRKFGEEYNNVRVMRLDDILENVQGKTAIIVLPLNFEKSIYSTIRKFGFNGDIFSDDMICFADYNDRISDQNTGTYTIEKHTQILISLMKEYGINNIVASPGTCNMNFVYSVQNDSYFNVVSCVDERSAGYMACGIAQTTGRPVALSCTGATSSRNYMSALTEAYYSKLPVLAITSSRDSFMINNGIDQITDRLHHPKDIVVYSTEIGEIENETEKAYCELEVNRALSKLTINKGGPVHINLITHFSKDFTVGTLPMCSRIEVINTSDNLPPIPDGSAIMIRPNVPIDIELQDLIEEFSDKYGVPVIGDNLSNYKGKNFVNISLMADQKENNNLKFDTIISVGEINRYIPISCRKSWRISEDGNIQDYYLNLQYFFNMTFKEFLKKYLSIKSNKIQIKSELKKIYNEMNNKIPELPFSNLWIARVTSPRLPENSVLYLGIYSTLKNWNYFAVPQSVYCYSTVGGFGIDGGISSMVGASVVNRNRVHFAIVGDLAFYYEMNVLGNKHIGSNVRIMVINNNGGNSLINGNGLPDTENMTIYVGAPNHYGGNDSIVIKAFAEALGYLYLYAENKEEYLSQVNTFINGDIGKPIVFEVKTTHENEAKALNVITHL